MWTEDRSEHATRVELDRENSRREINWWVSWG